MSLPYCKVGIRLFILERVPLSGGLWKCQSEWLLMSKASKVKTNPLLPLSFQGKSGYLLMSCWEDKGSFLAAGLEGEKKNQKLLACTIFCCQNNKERIKEVKLAHLGYCKIVKYLITYRHLTEKSTCSKDIKNWMTTNFYLMITRPCQNILLWYSNV